MLVRKQSETGQKTTKIVSAIGDDSVTYKIIRECYEAKWLDYTLEFLVELW